MSEYPNQDDGGIPTVIKHTTFEYDEAASSDGDGRATMPDERCPWCDWKLVEAPEPGWWICTNSTCISPRLATRDVRETRRTRAAAIEEAVRPWREALNAVVAENCEACGAVYPVCQEHITCRITFAARALLAQSEAEGSR